MKVKQLSALFAAFALSLGLATSCAAPKDSPTDSGAPEAPEAPADSGTGK